MILEKITTNNEKLLKATLIESMLDEVGMSKQELIDLLVSVSKEKSADVSESKEYTTPNFSELSYDNISEILDKNFSEDVSKYLSLEELKKLEAIVGLSLTIKHARKIGLKFDSAEISRILEIFSKNIQLEKSGLVKADGKNIPLSQNKIKELNSYLQGQISLSQQQQVQINTPGQAQQQNQNDPKSQNFLNRVVNIVRTQTQAVVSAVMGGSQKIDVSTNTLRVQNQMRSVESANRQLKRSQQKASILGNISKVSSRGSEKFVTVRARSKDGTIQEKQVNIKDLAKEKKISTTEAENLVKDIEKAEDKLNKEVDKLKKTTPDIKIIAVYNDDKGKLIVEAEIKGTKVKIPAEEFASQAKNPTVSNISDGKSKPEDENNRDSQLKIYEQVGSAKIKSTDTDKEKKAERSENLKSELTKLDAIADSEKLRKSQEKDNDKQGIRNEIGAERPDVAKQAADIQDQMKDPSLKYSTVDKTPINVEPKEKVEVKESKKTDETLKKLDVIADKQKLLEGLSEIKDTMKTAIHDKMDEAMKNKDLMAELRKDKLLNPENFIKK